MGLINTKNDAAHCVLYLPYFPVLEFSIIGWVRNALAKTDAAVNYRALGELTLTVIGYQRYVQ